MLGLGFLFVNTLSAQITASQTQGCAPLVAVQFNNNMPGATGIAWNFGNGASSTSANPTHTFQNPGTYTVTFTANGGISQTLTINVLASPVVSFSITGASGGCIPLPVTFQDNSTAGSGASIVSWSWDFGDGGVSTGANPNPTHVYTLVGINDVALVATDNNGCSSVGSINDAVVTSTPPAISLGSTPANTSACNPPLTVAFNVSGSSNSPQGAALVYAWQLGNGETAAVANPPAQTYTANGDYPISVIVTDNIGCSSQMSTNVFIGSPQSGIELLGGPNFCDTVFVVNQSDPATTSIDWGIGPNSNYAQPPDTVWHVYNTPGDYTIDLTVSSPGCSSTSSVDVSIDNVDVSFTSSPNFTCNPSLTVDYVAEAENADSYVWTFLGDGGEYTGTEVTYTHNSPATEDPYFQGGPALYGATLTITTPAGCVGSYSAFNDTIWVPYAGYGVDVSDGCAPLTVTFADSSSATTEIVQWVWHFGDGNVVTLDNMDEAYAYTYEDHGDFEPYLVIFTEEGCQDTSFVVPINVGTTSNPGLNFNQIQVCPNEPIDFQVLLPDDYDVDFWSIQTDNNQFSGCPGAPTFNGGMSSAAGFHDVTVFVNYNGCLSENTISNAIEVLGPVGHFVAKQNCEDPFSVDFAGDITGSASWTYDFGDGQSFNSSSAQSPTHTYAATGDYLVTLTSVAGTGCPPFVDTLSLKIRDVQAGLTLDQEAYCVGDIVIFNASASEDVYTYCNEGYLWIFDPALGQAPYRSETFTTEIEVTQSGEYLVQMVAQDYNGCTDTASVTLGVYGVEADFEYTAVSPCLPLEVQFEDFSIADTTIASWSWNFGGGNGSTEANPEFTFNGNSNSSFTIFLEVTDILGCNDITSITISPDMPTGQFSASDTQICAGDEVTFNAAVPGYVNYSWDFGNGDEGDQTSETVVFSEGGIYTVSLAVLNAAGCADTVNFLNYVAVQDYPNVGFSTSVDDVEHLCYPILIEFTDTSNAVVFAYRDWDLGTGFPVVNSQTVGTIYETPGIYLVSLEVGTTFGCVSTYERAFEIEGPVADFTLSTNALCLYDSVVIAMIDSSDVAYFMWDFGNGQDSAMVDPVTYTYNDIPSSGGTFVQLILWSTDSVCSASVQKPFTINQTIADFDRNFELMEEDTVHCFGLVDLFGNQSIDANSYLWDFGNGGSSTLESPLYNYPVGGDFEVTLYAFNTVTGCSDTLSKPMKVYPEMVVGAEDGLACAGDTIFLEAFGGSTYAWSPPEVLSNPFIANPYIFDDQNNALLVLITDTNECSQTLSLVADYIYEPPYPIWSDSTILYGNILFIDYPQEPYHTYTWYGMNGGSCPGCGTENFTPVSDMLVGLVVTDELGCYEASFEYAITVDSELFFYMPNAFTPNSDGLNDLLHPVIEQALPEGYEFTVWNRQGEVVWESNDINEKWRGNSTSSEYFAQVELYVWRVLVRDLKSFRHEFIGHVTLIR
jgi:gliding motility-associated-like protein